MAEVAIFSRLQVGIAAAQKVLYTTKDSGKRLMLGKQNLKISQGSAQQWLFRDGSLLQFFRRNGVVPHFPSTQNDAIHIPSIKSQIE